MAPFCRARLDPLVRCANHLRMRDAFTDVLRLVAAQSVFSGGLAAGGDWSVRFRAHGKVKLYAVADGGCWLRVDRKARRLEQGDVLLLAGASSFVLGSSRVASPSRESCPVAESRAAVAQVGTGKDCLLLGAIVTLDPASAPFFTSALPSLVHLREASAEASDLRWLIARLDRERRSGLPGAELVASQLAQLVLLQVLRAQLVADDALPPGWLRALRDPRLARAIRAVHDEPGHGWRLEELARAAGMSRARFAAAFKDAAGIAPLAYVTTWRMHVARQQLRERAGSVVEIALGLGYASESAFSHAFKRVVGMGPRAYRETIAQVFETPAPASARLDA